MEDTAYHESGHVVMAHFVGARPLSVTIEPDWDDGPERSGDTRIAWDESNFSSREMSQARVRVALAGPVAEMLYTGDPFHPAAVAEWSADWREAWHAAADLVSSETRRMKWLEEITIELYHFFNREDIWEAIAIIADHLLAHETLDEDLLDEIVSEWR